MDNEKIIKGLFGVLGAILAGIGAFATGLLIWTPYTKAALLDGGILGFLVGTISAHLRPLDDVAERSNRKAYAILIVVALVGLFSMIWFRYLIGNELDLHYEQIQLHLASIGMFSSLFYLSSSLVLLRKWRKSHLNQNDRN